MAQKNKPTSTLLPSLIAGALLFTLAAPQTLLAAPKEERAQEKSAVHRSDKQEPSEHERKSKSDVRKKEPNITLYQTGLLQLAAHDLFDVDRETEIDAENGLLDLSTVLDHGEDNIATGGESRNSENILNFTAAKKFGDIYLNYKEEGDSNARKKTIQKYHNDLAKAYKKLFGTDLPSPKDGSVTMTENLALRTVHDVLPEEITFNAQTVDIFDPSLAGQVLAKQERRTPSETPDGQIAEAFQNITLPTGPDSFIMINLLEKDRSFGEQFQTDVSFDTFMAELKDGRYNQNEEGYKHIRELFAKGLNI